MATRTNYFIQETLDLIYLNQGIANIGDATGLRGSTAAGNIYLALLVGDVETTYGNYARVAIPRSGSGFSRTNNVITNVAQLDFPESTSGSDVITKIALYDQVSGGNQLHKQTLPNPLYAYPAHQPIVKAGVLTITGS